jgi:hypothetical protein
MKEEAERLASAARREPMQATSQEYHEKDAVAASAASHCWMALSRDLGLLHESYKPKEYC